MTLGGSGVGTNVSEQPAATIFIEVRAENGQF
jgi:hypothetical protein